MFLFFFSSRRRHTRLQGDWSSDVCSSDLWDTQYEVVKHLGQGAQGVVYLAKRDGVDGYHTNVALKLFYRQPSRSIDHYLEEMQRVAHQALLISRIQHDNLIAIQNFIAMDETRVLVMEWVDGLDVSQLLDVKALEQIGRASCRERV